MYGIAQLIKHMWKIKIPHGEIKNLWQNTVQENGLVIFHRRFLEMTIEGAHEHGTGSGQDGFVAFEKLQQLK